ncbi:E3 ubiquitin-protein ligase PDZRN3-like [Tubulanus polymorphus]|uniref:E3 ubiquitin-protein ligase PDZRN3-like n=1 Tax=Tubulanus polymorphus TaxID=672921 RepID=UPI003DA69256
MGLQPDQFVVDVEDQKKCVLCKGVFDNPLQTVCGHVFCSACIIQWIYDCNECPHKCQKLVVDDLTDILDLRNIILNMQVRCKYADKGCKEVVTVTNLPLHAEKCGFKPMKCNGCAKDVCRKDLVNHSAQTCPNRILGTCPKGCGLVLYLNKTEHDCLEALRAHVANQEIEIESLRSEMYEVSAKFVQKEQACLSEITNLHGAIQAQAVRFQEKIEDYKKQLAKLSEKVEESLKVDKEQITLVLDRHNGSLGFNITGGCLADNYDGIFVSRITENSPARRQGIQTNDRIIKVNGQDLSKSSHEEAVEAFRAAKEPIVVEVLRRNNNSSAALPPQHHHHSKHNTTSSTSSSSSSSSSNKMKSRAPATLVSVSTQTDDIIENQAYYGMYRPPTPPPMYNYSNGLYQPASRQPVAFSPSADLGLTDIEMANGYEYDDTYDDDRPFEMEYEEVSLRRTEEEKLGLTLVYGSAVDEITDIFISEIEPYSIAAQDGRIREGDQILQINGQEVHSREQAIHLFSQNREEITLLLARPQLQFDDGFMEERQCMLDDLHMEMLDQHHSYPHLPRGLHHDEEGGTTDTATTENSSHKHEKDSGVGRTDDSTKNDESSEQELLENESMSPALVHKFQANSNLGSGELHHSNDSFTSNDQEYPANEISAEECEKFREVLESRCSNVENSLSSSSTQKNLSKNESNSQSSLEKELAILNKEMEHIQIECQEIVETHLREQTKIKSDIAREPAFRSPRLVPRMGTRLECLKMHAQNGDQMWLRKNEFSNTSGSGSNTSAYNTGDSCRSTPLTLELNPQMDQENGNGLGGSMLCLNAPCKPSLQTSDSEKSTQTIGPKSPARSGKEQQKDDHSAGVQQSLSSDSIARHQAANDGSNTSSIYDKYATVMYTNKANLEHTIQVQQQMFQQQIKLKQKQGSTSPPTGQQCETPTSPAAPPSESGNISGSTQQMEWVVKRRADGSRYITRRPVRNKLLKERAKKLSEERSGMTTDDDAMSEMKLGRYWNKDERKKHLEKAKEHKRRKEIMRQKMETLKETNADTEPVKKEATIVELSHRKMNKHKTKKVFDDFTTVQEMLAHGSKVSDGKTYNPLLSVTTV